MCVPCWKQRRKRPSNTNKSNKMATKQEKSALTREINSLRENLEYEMQAVSKQTPDKLGYVWRFGEKKHHIGYINGLISELNSALTKRAEMDGKVAELLPYKKAVSKDVANTNNNVLPNETPVSCDESHSYLVSDKAEKIECFMIENNVTLQDVVDVVISNNGIIGVGLITLGEQLKGYVHGKIKPNPESVNY